MGIISGIFGNFNCLIMYFYILFYLATVVNGFQRYLVESHMPVSRQFVIEICEGSYVMNVYITCTSHLTEPRLITADSIRFLSKIDKFLT